MKTEKFFSAAAWALCPAVVTAVAVFCLASCSGRTDASLKEAVAAQLAAFPESTAQDVYKSFCQDYLGPEHLIPDPESARQYMQSELSSYREDLAAGEYEVPAERYYPVGDSGNYIRVDLSVVLDSLVSSEALLDAFVESANAGQNMTPDEWKAKWAEVEAVLRSDFPSVPGLQDDLAAIDSLVTEGHLILHHSPAFNQAYHPHYRIIQKDIFARSILPLL